MKLENSSIRLLLSPRQTTMAKKDDSLANRIVESLMSGGTFDASNLSLEDEEFASIDPTSKGEQNIIPCDNISEDSPSNCSCATAECDDILLNQQGENQESQKQEQEQHPKPLVTQRQNEKASRYRRSVSFAPSVHCRETLSFKDYTEEEFLATWYTRNEKAASLYQMRQEVRFIEEGKIRFDDSNFCLRGLERQTTKKRIERSKLYRTCVAAVWEEQNRQWDRDEDDQNRIAQIYSNLTRMSQTTAHITAYRDAAFVKSMDEMNE